MSILPSIALLLAPALCAQGGLQPPGLLEGMAPDASELDLRTTPVVRAVQRAADSVVSIYVHDARNGRIAENVEGQGSGVIVDRSGLVITNWHVVAQVVAAPTARMLEVRLRDDRRFDATVLSSSPDHDLALLQLALGDDEVKPVTAGRSESLMVGETVVAIGNPQGQANTVTVGVLSAIDRSIAVRTPDGMVRNYQGLVQTDAAINRGNSGGALLDITGKLIGINNAMASNAENIGFAIPVDTVKQVFQDVLLSSENLANVWLGFTVDDAQGSPVVDEVPAGPAARAGLKPGDRILSVFGKPVRDKLELTRAIAVARPGQAVPLGIQRGERAISLRAIARSGIDREIAFRTGRELDAITAETDPDLLRRATRAFYSGDRRRRVPLLPVALRVSTVQPDSPAAALGFAEGDIVLATRVRDWVNFRTLPLRSIEDFADRARDAAGGQLPVVVLRDDETLEGTLDVRRL